MKKSIILIGALWFITELTGSALAYTAYYRESLKTQNQIHNFVTTRRAIMDQRDYIKNARRENLYPSNRYVIRYGQYHYKTNHISFWQQNHSQHSQVPNVNSRIWNAQTGSDYVIQYPNNENVLKNIGVYRSINFING